MTNRDLIQEYISGRRRYNATNHLGYTDAKLWNYSTVICEVNRSAKKAKVNVRKYSRTTSKIQSMLRTELAQAGFEVEEYEGPDAWDAWGRGMWNFGYMGAPRWTVAEFKPDDLK